MGTVAVGSLPAGVFSCDKYLGYYNKAHTDSQSRHQLEWQSQKVQEAQCRQAAQDPTRSPGPLCSLGASELVNANSVGMPVGLTLQWRPCSGGLRTGLSGKQDPVGEAGQVASAPSEKCQPARGPCQDCLLLRVGSFLVSPLAILLHRSGSFPSDSASSGLPDTALLLP